MTRPQTGTNARPDLPLAVVVGAGGMGMAAARRLGERYRLLLVDINEERLRQQLGSLREEGYDAVHCACDITSHESVTALAATAQAQGPMRVLAHVAGLSPSMADWQTILRVNLMGVHRVAEALLPLAGQGTAAIFISSLAGHMAAPAPDVITLLEEPLAKGFLGALEQAVGGAVTTQLAYQLSKFALMRYVRQRAAQWGQRGARIVSLSPGLIATPMGALEYAQNPVKYDLLAKTPVGREGTMLEIADAIDFLASDRASFISGTDLLVDGGIAAALAFPQ